MALGSSDAARATGTRSVFVLGWMMAPLIAHVTAKGHDATPIRGLPGLRGRDLADPDIRVPDDTAREAWRLATAITGDPALGVHLAEGLPRGALDLVEYAFRSSPTLAVGLARLVRYGRLLNDRLGGRVLRTPSEVRVVLGDPTLPAVYPQRAESSLALVLRLARESTTPSLTPIDICFLHEAPLDPTEHRRFFRGPVRWSAGVNAIAFTPTDVDRPLASADEALALIVRRRLDKLLAEADRSGETSVAARVRRVLLDAFGQGGMSAARVSRVLGMSERSLSRRLLEERTSFRGVLERARGEIAASLLREGGASVAEVAFFLGYSEPAAFHRAFKRWTGQTPAEYRRRAPRV